MDKMKINLHIHSNFSDGNSSISEIIQKAINCNLEMIAITDHCTNSWKSGIIPTLDTLPKISKYLQTIEYNKQKIIKDKENLIILKGVEIDLGSSKDFIFHLINPHQYDLILFEYLETLDALNYCSEILEKWKSLSPSNLENHPLYGLAHFDPSIFFPNEQDTLISFLKENHMFFEFNSRYSDYYSMKNQDFFNKLRIHDILVSVGSDAHEIFRINEVENAIDMIRMYDLEGNLNNLLRLIQKNWTKKA
jgi:histidinol phosphatase-like PHP family hydrolase